MSFKCIITGLDASGKTRLSAEIAETTGAAHIEDDAHRYVVGSNWTKKPAAVFVASLSAAAEHSAKSHQVAILDCGYNDVYDPEGAMRSAMRDAVLSAPPENKPLVFILSFASLRDAVEAIVVRVIGRASSSGLMAPGACAESARDAAGLLIKAIENYDVNTRALDEFAAFAADNGCVVFRGPYDVVRIKALAQMIALEQ